MPIPPTEFRQTLSRWPSGVTIVSMRDGDAEHGITVSAFSSLSLEPPLIAVAIARRARAHGFLERLARFAVSVLREDQRHLSDRFAGRPVDLDEPPFEPFDELPVVRGAVAHIACTIVQRVTVGDHTLYVGQVEAARVSDEAPLVYHRGGYHRIT